MKLSFRLCVVLLLLWLVPVHLVAQEKPKRDSIYEKIENYSKKGKVQRFLYHLIFRNVSDAAAVPSKDDVVKAYVDYRGKFIRNIYITSYDPLGYNSQMEKRDSHWIEEVGNRMHMRTREFAVRGYLLLKKGDAYNQQKIYESERILRDTRFINRVLITPVEGSVTADSLDLSVKVLDSWSLEPTFNFSGSKIGGGMRENNFLGMGHEVIGSYQTDVKTKQKSFFGSYAANNIYGTYINALLVGQKDMAENENVAFHAYRIFFSPLTKWAGGASFNYYRRRFQIPDTLNSNPDRYPVASLKANVTNLWAGYQFPLKRSSSNEITDNIVTAVKFNKTDFLQHPGDQNDPGHLFRSYSLYLGSIGYNQRRYLVKKNVYNYDIPEDVPYGALLSGTVGGMKPKDAAFNPYIGVMAGYGSYTKMGYFNYRAEYGTFIKNEKDFRSTFRVNGLYFSPLREWGFAQVRHFLSETLVLGNVRSNTLSDRINLSSAEDFPAFTPFFLGEDKLVVRYQLQFFIKKSWKNFQINPYFTTAFGWLSPDNSDVFASKTHTKFGVGVLFYNPYLAFNRFQISFMYYPRIPFDERPAFEFNRYRNDRISMNGFGIGEPQIVGY